MIILNILHQIIGKLKFL